MGGPEDEGAGADDEDAADAEAGRLVADDGGVAEEDRAADDEDGAAVEDAGAVVLDGAAADEGGALQAAADAPAELATASDVALPVDPLLLEEAREVADDDAAELAPEEGCTPEVDAPLGVPAEDAPCGAVTQWPPTHSVPGAQSAGPEQARRQYPFRQVQPGSHQPSSWQR
ncbi:MAG: hypothetical protein HY904_01725 [Deltaproteobacteria bacterium]|nr:hypothetical protein [Deltaproteobacteria bacterium]